MDINAFSQLSGLIVSTALTVTLIMCLHFFVIKKQQKGERPTNKLMVVLEGYYSGFSKFFGDMMDGKNAWALPYLFVIFNFILINSLMPWIGFEATPTSLMFTFPLALITFIGIYVLGIGTMGIWGFIKHKYSNPIEIFGQFAPLLSMAVRLFAATLAGAIIGNVPWIIVNALTLSPDGEMSIISTWFPMIQILFMWVWKIIDTALSLLQAFVFTTLTAILWTMETGPSWSAAKRRALKAEENGAKAPHRAYSNVTTVKVIYNGKEINNNDNKY